MIRDAGLRRPTDQACRRCAARNTAIVRCRHLSQSPSGRGLAEIRKPRKVLWPAPTAHESWALSADERSFTVTEPSSVSLSLPDHRENRRSANAISVVVVVLAEDGVIAATTTDDVDAVIWHLGSGPEVSVLNVVADVDQLWETAVETQP